MKTLKVTVDNQAYEVTVEPLDAASEAPVAPAAPSPQPQPSGGTEIPSPLAGKVVEVKVSAGQQVAQGDTVMVLEAMKMNTLVTAPSSGQIANVYVTSGDMVEEGQALVAIS